MLESMKFRGIHVRCFFSVEHSFNHCFDKFTGDVIGELSPNIVPGKLSTRSEYLFSSLSAIGSTSIKIASTSGPRHAGNSEQLSIADRSKCVYAFIMFIPYTFRENALLISMGAHRLKTWPGFYLL